MSTQRRTLGVYSRVRPLGPNGEKICYNCGGPLPKGKPFNCSPKCSEEWRCKTSPSHTRFLLHKRDKGVCALCDVDTEALKQEHDALSKGDGGWSHDNDIRRAFRKDHGIPPGRACSDWWDADHIVPVIEGGGECDLSNFRTLCIPCHRKVTRELHGRRAAKNREARTQLKDEARPLFAELSSTVQPLGQGYSSALPIAPGT
jgi:hypothetical protein